jgi:aminoglycoside phosphotransferase (APT) family kinase protein
MPETIPIERLFSAWLGAARLASFNVLASGWETTVFEFRLATPCAPHALPANAPLVLRLYSGEQASIKGAREFCVMSELARRKFPVPYPFCFESNPASMGSPFLIMSRLAGGPLLQLSGFIHATRCFLSGFLPFVRTHACLHRLRVDALNLAAAPALLNPTPGDSSRPLLQRMLAAIASRIEDGPLPWLRVPLAWARERADSFEPRAISLLHLDYHPLNVLVHGRRLLGVIDWVSADVGDAHLDVATTAAIMSSSAMARPRWMGANARGNLLRRLYAGTYLALYHRQSRLDFERLRYCQAVAALFRLSTLGMMLQAGAESVGYRRQALAEVTPGVMKLLARYFERKSGLTVNLTR